MANVTPLHTWNSQKPFWTPLVEEVLAGPPQDWKALVPEEAVVGLGKEVVLYSHLDTTTKVVSHQVKSILGIKNKVVHTPHLQ